MIITHVKDYIFDLNSVELILLKKCK